jgi:hypothetical protein
MPERIVACEKHIGINAVIITKNMRTRLVLMVKSAIVVCKMLGCFLFSWIVVTVSKNRAVTEVWEEALIAAAAAAEAAAAAAAVAAAAAAAAVAAAVAAAGQLKVTCGMYILKISHPVQMSLTMGRVVTEKSG